MNKGFNDISLDKIKPMPYNKDAKGALPIDGYALIVSAKK